MILVLLMSFSFFAQSLELDTKNFYFCSYKTAIQVKNRTIRVHYFPEEKKCAVFYAIAGNDKLVASGRWLAFCNTKAQQIVENLQKELWKCKAHNQPIKVFYPFEPEKPSTDSANSES